MNAKRSERKWRRRNTLAAVWERVDYSRPSTECWPWLGPLTNTGGYGAANGETQANLAREFGVSPSGIRVIVIRKAWKHVP
jgi:hypothetical protein